LLKFFNRQGWQFGKLLTTQILLKFVQEAQRKSAPNISSHAHTGSNTTIITSKSSALTGPLFGSYTGRVGSQRGGDTPTRDESDEPISYDIDSQVFNSKLPEAFRSMVNPVLKYCMSFITFPNRFVVNKQRGIKHASLITSGNVLQSTNTDLSLNSNLKILISHTTDLSK
jgi:hypothetical protein